MGQFNASVFKNWAKKAAPKYTEKKMNLRMAMAEFVEAIDQLPTDTNTLIQNQTAALTDAVINNSSFGVNTAFGMAIMVLAYSIGHVSGAHLYPAVTLSLFLSGNCNFIQGTANVCAQVVGSILAASFLYGMVPNASESSLGANAISPGFNTGEALLGEVFMTGFLCFVVHMCVADPRNKTISPMAPLAIGFAVFLAHAVLIPVDGCSINPARSLGPAILSCNWGNFWVFVVGPFVGSLFSVFFWLLVSLAWDIEAETVTPAPASPGELPGVTSDIKYSGYRA
ncbi:putative Aquaporin-1 [Nannochloris sp. 'desiccata']|nr:putative Aquaporin-1 [Chlorella desiccata (nom. nud.)]